MLLSRELKFLRDSQIWLSHRLFLKLVQGISRQSFSGLHDVDANLFVDLTINFFHCVKLFDLSLWFASRLASAVRIKWVGLEIHFLVG